MDIISTGSEPLSLKIRTFESAAACKEINAVKIANKRNRFISDSTDPLIYPKKWINFRNGVKIKLIRFVVDSLIQLNIFI